MPYPAYAGEVGLRESPIRCIAAHALPCPPCLASPHQTQACQSMQDITQKSSKNLCMLPSSPRVAMPYLARPNLALHRLALHRTDLSLKNLYAVSSPMPNRTIPSRAEPRPALPHIAQNPRGRFCTLHCSPCLAVPELAPPCLARPFPAAREGRLIESPIRCCQPIPCRTWPSPTRPNATMPDPTGPDLAKPETTQPDPS